MRSILVALVLLASLGLVRWRGGEAQAQAACVTPPSGMVGWWPGDGNANDIVGGNNGLLQGGTLFAAGEVGQAYSLDGVDDYVDLGASSAFNLDAMTLDAWVLVDPNTNTSDRRVISKDNIFLSVPRKEFALKTSSFFWTFMNGTAQFEILNDANGGFERVSAPTALTAGWHHLAGVRDTTAARLELWVDGQLVASKIPTVFGPIDSVADTVIGQVGPSFNGEYFSGLIDEVEIFSRALSATEIRAIFLAGSSGKCKGPTLTRALSAQVQALVNAGTLNLGQGNSLTTKLALVLQSLSLGQTRTGCNRLHAFINEVNDLINNGVLTPAQGQSLVDAATNIRTAIGC